MRRYYKGNVEVLKVTNLTIDKNVKNIIQKRVIVKKDELFYKNMFGVIIRFDDRCPIPTYDEVIDYMERHLIGESGPGNYCSGSYVDEESLEMVELTSAEKNQLIKTRAKKRK